MKWIGNRQNLSRYNKWENPGQGCGGDCFDYMHRLVLNTRAQYAWRAEDKTKKFPYICISQCTPHYVWQPTARRCVKVADPTKGIVKQAEATVACAEDGGRLLSINTCEEMAGLQIDLWRQNPTITTSYWVGIFNSGFQNYEGQKRTSKSQVTINSRGQLGLKQGGLGPSGCTATFEANLQGLNPSKDGSYGQFIFIEPKTAKIQFTKFQKADSNLTASYMCEKENDWSCPNGYTIFQEVCYKMFPENVSLGTADQRCEKEGGQVMQVDTRLHATFLTAWLNQWNYSTVWLGHRRHTFTLDPNYTIGTDLER